MVHQRKRAFRGRSKKGCLACRMRRIRCDEGRPTCNNCHKGDRLCIGSKDGIVEGIDHPRISLASPRSREDEEMFYRFTANLAPTLEVFQSSQFWTKGALAAAQSSPQIFDALLALQTLYDVSILHIMQPNCLAKRYQDAITWYSRSIQASIMSIPQDHRLNEIFLLLFNSYVYVLIELRQGHHENARSLVCTAFAVAHSARICLLKSRSILVFSCLEAMLNITLLGAFKSTSVSRNQWTSVFRIASQIATDLCFPDSTILKLDLLNVIYNVHQAIEGDICSQPGYAQVDEQLARWYERLLHIENLAGVDIMHLSRISLLRCMYMHIIVQWRTYFDKPNVDMEYVRATLTELIVLADKLTLGSTASENLTPLWTIEGAFVPICLAAAWHWRDQSLMALSTQRINTFWTPERAKWMQNVVDYIATLVGTKADEPTALEMQLFGEKPKAFLCWHVYACVHHLLRMS